MTGMKCSVLCKEGTIHHRAQGWCAPDPPMDFIIVFILFT